jgi:hypothetical protein
MAGASWQWLAVRPDGKEKWVNDGKTGFDSIDTLW